MLITTFEPPTYPWANSHVPPSINKDIFCCGTMDFPKVVDRFDISSLRLSQNETTAADLFSSRASTRSSVRMAIVRLFVLALFVPRQFYISNRLLKLHVNFSNAFYIQTNPSSTLAQPPQLSWKDLSPPTHRTQKSRLLGGKRTIIAFGDLSHAFSPTLASIK